MKTEQYWEFVGCWPADGLSHEKSSYVTMWRSHPFVIVGSFKADGRPTFNVYRFEWVRSPEPTKYQLIEYGWTTLTRAKRFVDNYHAGLAKGVHQTT